MKHFLILTLSVLLAACASKVRLDELPPVEDRKIDAVNTTPVTVVNNGNTSGQVIAQVNAGVVQDTNPTQGLLANRSIYFDFDSFTIKPEFQAILEAHAKFLIANKTRKIALEGHTDERGGREYNLALGQKRSNAVAQALRVLGVNEAQMEAVSFGEEKPKATGADEKALAENRRADISYR